MRLTCDVLMYSVYWSVDECFVLVSFEMIMDKSVFNSVGIWLLGKQATISG